jgi:hypothetical protein
MAMRLMEFFMLGSLPECVPDGHRQDCAASR